MLRKEVGSSWLSASLTQVCGGQRSVPAIAAVREYWLDFPSASIV